MAYFDTVIIGFGFTYDVPFYFVVVAFLILQPPNVLAEFGAVAFVCVLKCGFVSVVSLFECIFVRPMYVSLHSPSVTVAWYITNFLRHCP